MHRSLQAQPGCLTLAYLRVRCRSCRPYHGEIEFERVRCALRAIRGSTPAQLKSRRSIWHRVDHDSNPCVGSLNVDCSNAFKDVFCEATASPIEPRAAC